MFRSGAKSQHDDELLCDPTHIFTGRKQKAKAKQRVHRHERRAFRQALSEKAAELPLGATA